MTSFKSFLSEQDESYGKLKHLEHAEDHPINDGIEGYHKAAETLSEVHAAMKGEPSNVKITTKYDGSPSVVFGRHPHTGRFFVASKSAFNKNPKINYTPEDIEKNHGHAPGLVSKLKAALEHLPKVAPRTGVYQGDLMYTDDDVRKEGGKYHFTPNTITYSTPTNSEHGKKIAKAKLGIVVHTKYHGDSLENMSAGFDPDTHNFKKHSDVHMISPNLDAKKFTHDPENQRYFEHHMEFANDIASRTHPDALGLVSGQKEHMATYINQTVRTGETPSTQGLIDHITKKYETARDKLKTDKAKIANSQKMYDLVDHISKNKQHFDNAFAIHHHLQKAKDALVKSLNNNQEFEHSVAGKPTNPEGYVATHKGYPTKLVDRAEFSRLNFTARPR